MASALARGPSSPPLPVRAAPGPEDVNTLPPPRVVETPAARPARRSEEVLRRDLVEATGQGARHGVRATPGHCLRCGRAGFPDARPRRDQLGRGPVARVVVTAVEGAHGRAVQDRAGVDQARAQPSPPGGLAGETPGFGSALRTARIVACGLPATIVWVRPAYS